MQVVYIFRNVIIFMTNTHTHTHTHTHTSKYIWICAMYIRVVCFVWLNKIKIYWRMTQLGTQARSQTGCRTLS